jgi:hypothetical protein
MKNYLKPEIKNAADLKARKRLLKAYIQSEKQAVSSFASFLGGVVNSKTALLVGSIAVRMILKRWSR